MPPTRRKKVPMTTRAVAVIRRGRWRALTGPILDHRPAAAQIGGGTCKRNCSRLHLASRRELDRHQREAELAPIRRAVPPLAQRHAREHDLGPTVAERPLPY